MDFKLTGQTTKCLFFDPLYAKIQKLPDFQRFDNGHLSICFSLSNHHAVSMAKSPFGGFLTRGVDKQELLTFYQKIEKSLKVKGCKKLSITQPQSIYPTVPNEWLIDLGFKESIAEIAHHIPIAGDLFPRLHSMQKRKLNAQKEISISISKEKPDQLEEIHDFLTTCRAHQGLQISVDFPTLKAQTEAFPERYHLFTARQNQHLMSAVIMCVATEHIVYYFLPGTLPKYKKLSPMVHLIAHIYQYYQERGFQYIDLGISSIQEAPQTSLITFKERMGGIRGIRETFIKSM